MQLVASEGVQPKDLEGWVYTTLWDKNCFPEYLR